MPSKYIPKPKTKMLPCKYCNQPISVGWKTKTLPKHLECSIKYMAEYQRQMHEKSGPLYDKWLARTMAALAVYGRATPPPPENVQP